MVYCRFLVWWLLAGISAFAQTTAFNYQGKLTDAGNVASGSYDMQFKLFDTVTVGTGAQQGSTVTVSNVSVSNGGFSVQLDFGTNVFTGAARFLEVGVRPASSPNPHTILAPRQAINSAPYAIQTVNATQLGGLPATRYIATDANGNVGIGTSTPLTNLDVRGVLTLDPGASPTLFTSVATTDQNRYLHLANSPLAQSASGLKAGGILVADSYDFANPGKNDLIVKGFVGIGTPVPEQLLHVHGGKMLLTGSDAAYTFRDRNSTSSADDWALYASGGKARLYNNTSGDLLAVTTTGLVGIGTTTPEQKLHVHGNEILSTGNLAGFAFRNRGSLSSADNWVWYSQDNIARLFRQNVGDLLAVTATGNVGIGTVNPTAKLYVNGSTAVSGSLTVFGSIFFTNYAGIGGTPICYNETSNGLVQCSSSLRYKSDLQPFVGGLNIVNRLRPITYKWKTDGSPDVGFGAEDVAEIEPLLITHNKQGEIQGVKYERLSVVFVNAIKEQQAHIEQQSRQLKKQQTQLDRQQREIAALRQAVKARKSSTYNQRRK